MSDGRKLFYLTLGVGIVIGLMLGLVVSGTLDSLLEPGVSALTGESRTRTPTEPQSGPDANVILAGRQTLALVAPPEP